MDQNTGGPVEPTQEDKTQAMLCWILGIVIGIISPVIFMLIGKDKQFVYANAMQCLTFHICVAIAWIVLLILTIVTFGIGMLVMPLLGIFALVISIMGAMAANSGKVYEPPVSGGLAKSWFKV